MKDVGQVLESNHDVSRTLPGNMKRCFAYCCIFPSGFVFDREQLVQQWLAQDFIPTEEKGREYFDLMFRWSLFRYSHSGVNGAQILDMNDLDGSLSFTGLELVDGAEEAKNANLQNKEGLQILEYMWGEDTHTQSSVVHADVLGQLRPNANIRELKVEGFGGDTLSSWIGDPSISSLASKKIYNCKNLTRLPPIGQLPSLKKLHIESLPNWSNLAENENSNLRSLRELVIRNCTGLCSLQATLPVLMKLEIDRCPSLSYLPRFPSLHSLKVTDCGDGIWSSLCNLRSLSSLVISGMTTLPTKNELQACENLSTLEISGCETPSSLPDDFLPARLTCLKIDGCPTLQALPGGLRYLQNLRKLQLQLCPNLSSTKPTDGLPVGLQLVIVSECPGLIQFFERSYRPPAIGMDQWRPSGLL